MELRLLNSVFSHDKREVRTFPGALPISISRKELKDIAFGYVWSVKADGTREFLFIDEKESKQISWWTLGRDLKTTRAPPLLDTNSVISILDVEVCDDIIYIFDALMVRNVVTIRKCVLERIDAAYAMLSDFPQHTQTQWWDDLKAESTMTPTKYNRNVCCILPGSTMKLVVKPFFLYSSLPELWPIVSKRLLNDGVVFTRLFQKYESYRSAPLAFIKWKPMDLITIDTVIHKDIGGRGPGVIFGIHMDFSFATKGNVIMCITRSAASGVTRSGKTSKGALKGVQDTPFARGNVDEMKFDLESIDGKVGEFGWDGTSWNLHRIREDKTKSNTIDTICKTIENLRDVIEFSEL